MKDTRTLRERIRDLDLPRALQVAIAGVVGLGSGVSLLAKTAEKESKDKMNENPDELLTIAQDVRKDTLHNLREQRLGAIELNMKDGKKKWVPLEPAESKIGVWEYIRGSHKAKDVYDEAERAYESRLFGEVKKGPLGMAERSWQRWNFVGKDTQEKLLFSAGAAVAVGVAGTVVFFNNLSMHHKLNKLVDNQQELK